MERHRLVVLLPVRNGAGLLDGWFAAVAPFADAVVALDDGSTDDTPAILESHPLVAAVLTHPRRTGFDQWDDHANRTELLRAAAGHGDWVLFLDADERIPAPDGDDLRSFVQREAVPGFAYGFRIHRATDDLHRYEPEGRWIYRMFALEDGQTLPGRRLHFVPIPETIPRRRWLRTSIRLLHVATTDPADGAHRIAKYDDADPRREWQDSYEHLGKPPLALEPIPSRSGPVVLPIHDRPDPDHPVLSAIVISRDDEDRIERCVRSVVDQVVSEPFEVIVVVSGSDATAEIVRARFPGVTVVQLDHPALPGEARNAGIAGARGDIIAFPSSHIELPQGALQARLDAHLAGWAMVTGPVINGNPTGAGWASYFLDHSTLLPDRPAGEMTAAPTRCSYVRFLLDQVGGFPETLRAGEDTAVNNELWRRGFSAYRTEGAAAIHTSLIDGPGALTRRHYERGRAWARLLLNRHGSRRRLVLERWPHLVGYLPARLSRIRHNVRAWGAGVRAPYRRALPLIVLGASAAWAGLIVGVIRGEGMTADAVHTLAPSGTRAASP